MEDYTDIKRGDLILSYEKTIASWIVRKFTSSQWSHVGIYAETDKYVSAVPFKGVSYKRLTQVQHFAVYRAKGITDYQRESVTQFCIDRLGKKYDFTQVLLLAWRILTHKLKKNKGDPHPNEYVCSELVAEAYATVGVMFGKIPDNVLPGTIADSTLTFRIR